MTREFEIFVVIPYRKGAKPHRADDQAFSTMATKQAHGLLQAAVNVEDCYFRMLKPREAANAQRFEQDYILTGNQGEQQTGAGNAVACNVAQWMGQRHAAVLA
jgi:DNA (cytosine-5)-methyltransferase 1